MVDGLLKILIEMACADGVITERERLHLEEQAEIEGVETEELNKLIDKELEKVRKNKIYQ